MEVIAYLKKEDGQKDEELDALKHQVKDIQVKALNDRDTLITKHEHKITELESTLTEKNEEVSWISFSVHPPLSLAFISFYL